MSRYFKYKTGQALVEGAGQMGLEIRLDEDRLQHWLARGAQPSNTVKKLMRAKGVSPTNSGDAS